MVSCFLAESQILRSDWLCLTIFFGHHDNIWHFSPIWNCFRESKYVLKTHDMKGVINVQNIIQGLILVFFFIKERLYSEMALVRDVWLWMGLSVVDFILQSLYPNPHQMELSMWSTQVSQHPKYIILLKGVLILPSRLFRSYLCLLIAGIHLRFIFYCHSGRVGQDLCVNLVVYLYYRSLQNSDHIVIDIHLLTLTSFTDANIICKMAKYWCMPMQTISPCLLKLMLVFVTSIE